jgi:hypothetical protein
MFPMTDHEGYPVNAMYQVPPDGIRYRRRSPMGLFRPVDLAPDRRLIICNGPLETAALSALGFQAVGRPALGQVATHLINLLQLLRPEEVVIVARSCGAEDGYDSEHGLIWKLVIHCGGCRMLALPWGRGGSRPPGATPGSREQILDLIGKSEVHRST